MKFLIAGFGSIGRRHLRNLQALGQEDIVLYRSHRSTLKDDEIAHLPVETDLEKALAHKPDGVIISNPDGFASGRRHPCRTGGLPYPDGKTCLRLRWKEWMR